MQQLEAALAAHHHHLLVRGLAVSQNPAHTEHVLQLHVQHLQRQQQLGANPGVWYSGLVYQTWYCTKLPLLLVNSSAEYLVPLLHPLSKDAIRYLLYFIESPTVLARPLTGFPTVRRMKEVYRTSILAILQSSQGVQHT